jgi:bifunctional UDP-N-acetylglucosamine pyrophosphorylase/glucosamine-1-phosphate N-acetyltransferase
VALVYKDGGLIESVELKEINQALGVNSYADLIKANQLMQERIHEALMQSGVKIHDPRLIYIDWDVRIAEKTEIYPFTVIERGVKIGKNCRIGPFCHLRSGVSVKDNTLIGNFVEAVRTKIGAGTLIKHFSYLGDSRIGNQVNIGAGCVTANFDGKKKNTTVIKDGAFIGSDTVLIAPVVIGKRAVTGAGAVITKHTRIPPARMAVGVPARILKKRA